MKILPERFLACMTKKDRDSLGKAGRTAAEASESNRRRTEKHLQKLIALELNRRGIVYISSGMHKKTSTQKGCPDFLFVYRTREGIPIPYAIECKTALGRVSNEQWEMMQKMYDNGWRTHVVRSFEEFKRRVFE